MTGITSITYYMRDTTIKSTRNEHFILLSFVNIFDAVCNLCKAEAEDLLW